MAEESGRYTSELEQLGQEALDAAERLEQSVQEVYTQILRRNLWRPLR